jgi:transposase
MLTPEAVKAREQRGLVIAATAKIVQKGPVWLVPSQSTNSKYTVSPDKLHPHCSCPDHVTTGCKCKHIIAVELVIQRELFDDGTEAITRRMTVTETIKKPSYKQDWPAYNAAQENEKHKFQMLLRDLCLGLPDNTAQPRQRGNQHFPFRDGIFSACYKVYSTLSCRRFMSDMRDAKDKGYVSRCPSKTTVFSVLESRATFEYLRLLVVEAAKPLKAIETHFCCDSSGFSGSRFDRWFDHKHGEHKIQRSWVKAHVMCGAKTNVITAVEIHGQHAGDSPQLKPLLATTAETFRVLEVSADLGYSSNSNLHAIARAGGMPLIPFKKDACPGQSRLWDHLYHYFHLHREGFLQRYHQRSNVESAFSMVKAKFGDGVRSKTEIAMKNEVLAKLVCHNVCCLISAMYELGVDPQFWQEQPSIAG